MVGVGNAEFFLGELFDKMVGVGNAEFFLEELFDNKAITYIPSVVLFAFVCLFVFLIIILDFVFINIQHFVSNP